MTVVNILNSNFQRQQKILHSVWNNYYVASNTQVNRMCRSRRVLATGGKQTEYGWTGSVFIHFYFL